ncbi:F0F1 ATP synthase subunit gamma [Phaeovibrio sulfidiphilus]|uniref:ATP synthase gamma chain n=1 Tax=Phaeovibrio sulfidiphilus TaxID=1220600 RepID=A0A8J7CE88_9PROT|nr:F0F1 ATP synthase subunit gamma [Phaeovibrio sulfidiphilus]MBE1237624.1 F0F1 ATP synthase subunit gamma [Phaeovibrio sulfidiphilus]
MATLKDLKARITSVKSTRKITSAMKMVAASRLRRAQDTAESARPYASRMARMLDGLSTSLAGQGGGNYPLLTGTGKDKVHLLLVMTADRGLCGGFNGSIIRAARLEARRLLDAGKEVRFYCVGRKGYDALKGEYQSRILGTHRTRGSNGPTYDDASHVANEILALYEDGQFDVCTAVYNYFRSAITQIVTRTQLIPVATSGGTPAAQPVEEAGAIYEYEPDEEALLVQVLPLSIRSRIFSGLLESFASEQGARMTAMDNASRNAGDMIDKLTLRYNRTRQAKITGELIEIISGAEAL